MIEEHHKGRGDSTSQGIVGDLDRPRVSGLGASEEDVGRLLDPR
jgi:hypothetical protein